MRCRLPLRATLGMLLCKALIILWCLFGIGIGNRNETHLFSYRSCFHWCLSMFLDINYSLFTSMPFYSPICTKSVMRILAIYPISSPTPLISPLPHLILSLSFPPSLTPSNLQLGLFQASCPLCDPVRWGPFSGGLVGELLCEWQRDQAGDGPDAGAAAGLLYQLAPTVAGRSAALCCQGMEGQPLLWWVNQRLGLFDWEKFYMDWLERQQGWQNVQQNEQNISQSSDDRSIVWLIPISAKREMLSEVVSVLIFRLPYWSVFLLHLFLGM